MAWGRRLLEYLAGAGVVWALGIALGLTVPVAPVASPSSTGSHTWVTIFCANLRVLTGCYLGLVTGSAASVVTLVLNGILVGISWSALTSHASGIEVLALLAPHGLLEVPGMLLAGAAGLMGCGIARTSCMGGPGDLSQFVRPLLLALPASVILIFMAAFIESWSISRL
jgi:stage II sporulation protein M